MTVQPNPNVKIDEFSNGRRFQYFDENGKLINEVFHPYVRGKKPQQVFISQYDIDPTFEEHEEPSNPYWQLNRDLGYYQFKREIQQAIKQYIRNKNSWKQRFLISPYLFLKAKLWNAYQMVRSYLGLTKCTKNCSHSKQIH